MEQLKLPLSVIQNDIPASWIDYPKCFKCRNVFQKIRNVQHHPCRLPCGHVTCSSCIATLRTKKSDFNCGICSYEIKYEDSSDWFRFEHDYFLMGFVNYQKHFLPYALQNVPPVPKLNQSSARSSVESVCVECSMSTKFVCVECSSNPYCEPCFFKVHSAGVVFKTHQIKHVNAISSTIGKVLGLCNSHNKKLIYYCQICLIPICFTCTSTSHNKHETKDLAKINEKVDLDEPIKILKSVRGMIEESKNSTVECNYKLDQFATSTAQNIFETFQSYHTILQNLEKDAYVELKKRTDNAVDELHAVQNCLDESGNQIKGIMHNLKQFKKVTPNDVNLSTIENEIMCLLENLMIDFNFEQFDTNLLDFDFNSFKKNCDLKDLCRIKFEHSAYKVQKKTFYTAKKMSTDDGALTYYSDISTNSSIADLSVHVESTKPLSAATRKVAQSKQQPTIKTRRVVINEVTDPTTFHVQDLDFKERYDQLVRACNQCAMKAETPKTVVPNEMYLVSETNKDEWCRGIVKEQNKFVKVYLVDQGRHVTVMKNQIRPISDELKNKPKGATTFTISNVEPTDGVWSDECNEVILQLALGSNATLIYSHEESGDCIIHLDYPTSIEETLLYLKYAKPQKICDEAVNQLNKEMTSEKKAIMQQLNKAKPFVKQVIRDEFYANVVNIVSPALLYVTSMDRDDEIKALCDKMQQFYGSSHSYPQKIYYPHLKMSCSVCIDDVWYRGRIEAHRPGCTLQVYLVDVGKHMNIEWRFLRALDDQFKSLQEGVTECSLVDIAPKNYEKEWSAEVTVELKRLSKNKLKAIVCETKLRTVAIELFIVKKNVHYQINAYLAQHQLAEWIGDGEMIVERANDSNCGPVNESAMAAAIMKEASQREFRITVKILDIVSPSEFYVTLIKYQSAITKMHTEIQHAMKTHNILLEQETPEWKVGDHCLVNAKLSVDVKKSWYRGRIESNMDARNFTVFLRDHGQTVFTVLTDLKPISHYLGNVIDGASKCHLANIKPTSSDGWAKAAIAEFKHMTLSVEECNTFAVSVYGEKNDDSLPVYLWGLKKPARDDPLMGAPMIWTNINEIFASKGYADCVENFKTIVDCGSVDAQMLNEEMTDFNLWLKKVLNVDADYQPLTQQNQILGDDDDFVLEAELDPDHQHFHTNKVTSWIPATPISKYFFCACPTYVDNNAVIYLHAEARKEYLKQLMYTINKRIGEVAYDDTYIWTVDEPCMVQYHVDKCFYRGVVKEVLPKKRFKVQFVDYGNCELCEANELRIANILGNVPIQASKYYLAYVKPISDDGIWDKKILEFIHVKIVNQSVYVRVEDNIDDEYVPCTMTVGAMDLIKTLIAEKLAEKTTDLNVNLNLPETYDFYHENSKRNERDVDCYKSGEAMDEFKKKIAKKNEAKREKEYFSRFDLNLSLDYIVEDSDVEVFQRNESFPRNSVEYDDDFQPHDTSTTISTAMKSFTLLPFKPIELTKDVTKFPCKVYEVLDTLHLFVEPIMQVYTDNFEIMEKNIKKLFSKTSADFDFSDSRSCLAPYSVDNCYYRAVISDRISKTHVRVRFVDYLNEEIVETKSLRECPVDIMKKPLKHFIVRLHGVKPAPRVRDTDIKRQLASLIGQTVLAFVVKNGDIPAVRLYDTENSSVLVYKSLIDSKFFIEIKG